MGDLSNAWLIILEGIIVLYIHRVRVMMFNATFNNISVISLSPLMHAFDHSVSHFLIFCWLLFMASGSELMNVWRCCLKKFIILLLLCIVELFPCLIIILRTQFRCIVYYDKNPVNPVTVIFQRAKRKINWIIICV
jgi:uncharacterized membrane protein (UPF0182 family)